MNKCKKCGKLTKNPSYCSKSCSASHTNSINPKRKLSRKCIRCGDICRNYRSTLCQSCYDIYLKGKKDHILNLSLSDYSNRSCISRLHKSSTYAHIRCLARSWSKPLGKSCVVCGYNKHVEVCHIKPISSFHSSSLISEVNSLSNIVFLCPNCHWEFDNNLISLPFKKAC